LIQSYLLVNTNCKHEELTMPMITIRYAAVQRKSGLTEAIAKAANNLSANVLHKNPSITAVTVEEMAPGHWFIGDKSLAAHELASSGSTSESLRVRTRAKRRRRL
jgi:phenylpyruvate tautomerase PptA (4-oxalocrotonate tautomerase family)